MRNGWTALIYHSSSDAGIQTASSLESQVDFRINGSQMIDLTKDGAVFTLTMNDGENRWNTTFVREFADALDEVEASSGPAALVTASANGKFFSNGLDLEWIQSTGENRGGDRTVFAAEFMALMGRLITLPIPTVCAINGHAFGAG